MRQKLTVLSLQPVSSCSESFENSTALTMCGCAYEYSSSPVMASQVFAQKSAAPVAHSKAVELIVAPQTAPCVRRHRVHGWAGIRGCGQDMSVLWCCVMQLTVAVVRWRPEGGHGPPTLCPSNVPSQSPVMPFRRIGLPSWCCVWAPGSAVRVWSVMYALANSTRRTVLRSPDLPSQHPSRTPVTGKTTRTPMARLHDRAWGSRGDDEGRQGGVMDTERGARQQLPPSSST